MAIGKVVHLFRTCSSTNDLAKELAHRGGEEGTVILADEQTQGRGTKGRTWHSPAELGLYASVILRPPTRDVSLFPLVAGIAAAEAIHSTTSLEVGLKWPNDVVWSGRKLGGILCESEFIGSEPSCVILGIGLNINQRRSDFPKELRSTAISLRMVLKHPVGREKLAWSLFQGLDRWYKKFLSGNKAEVIRAFEQKFIFPVGKVISVRTEKKRHTGTYLGFDYQARLMLQTSQDKIFFSPAEILDIG